MTDEGYTIRDKYQKPVDYEQLLFNQMNRISNNRSAGDLERYIDSIETLIIMLPINLRDKAREYKKENNVTFGISEKNKKSYDDLLIFINEHLEKTNLIFRTSYIKTYE